MHNILVAGMTNSGKTILARALVERYGYARIPGDSLVLALGEAFPQLHIAHDRELYQEACRRFAPFVVRLMRALAWQSRAPYVLDTFHVWPGDLAPMRDQIDFSVLFLGYPEADPEVKTAATLAYTRQHGGWPCELTPDGVRAKIELFIHLSRELRAECIASGFPFVDTSHGFEQVLERTIAEAVA